MSQNIKELSLKIQLITFFFIIVFWIFLDRSNPAILLFLLISSMRYVKYEEDRNGNVINAKLVLRGLREKAIFVLKPGLYFFPFILWWGKIYRVIPSENENYIKVDSDKVVLRSKEIGWKGIFFNNFILPYLRENWWPLILSFLVTLVVYSLFGIKPNL